MADHHARPTEPGRRRSTRRSPPRTTAGPSIVGVVGDEVWWTEPRPAEGGRRALVRLPADGRRGVGAARPVERAQPGHRVRRPALGRARRGTRAARWWSSSTSPTSGCTRYEPDGPAPGPRPLTPSRGAADGLRWVRPAAASVERGRSVVRAGGVHRRGPDRRAPGARRRAAGRLGGRGPRRACGNSPTTATGSSPGPGSRPTAAAPPGSPGTTRAMPWDGTALMVAEVTGDGTFERGPDRRRRPRGVGRPGRVGPRRPSAARHRDRSGWWNLQRLDLDARRGRGREPCSARARRSSAGRCGRSASAGSRRWTTGSIAVVHGRGATALGILDPETGEVVDAAGPWTELAPTLAVHGQPGRRRRGQPAQRVRGRRAGHRPPGGARVDRLAAHDDPVDPAYYPEPQIRTFTGPDGREIHAHVYPPHHPDCTAPDDELPPYVVWAHGGPTGRAPLVLDLEIAYFTSRGIGVAEVNYGGSTGYGREYREPAARAVGRGRRRGLRGRRPRPGRRGHRRPRPARHPGRQRGRLDRRRLPHRAPTSTPAARSSTRSST